MKRKEQKPSYQEIEGVLHDLKFALEMMIGHVISGPQPESRYERFVRHRVIGNSNRAISNYERLLKK